MIRYILAVVLSFFFLGPTPGQEHTNIEYAGTITIQDLKAHLSILASDSLEGRETGTQGQKMAAAYISHQFENDGLEPIIMTPSGDSFLQTFDLIKKKPATSWIKIGDVTYNNSVDFIYVGDENFKEPIQSDFVFVGEGTAKDYKAILAKGKNVLLYCDCNRTERKAKAILAREEGAKNIFIMTSGSDDEFQYTLNMYNRYSGSVKLEFAGTKYEDETDYFLISPKMGELILQTERKTIQEEIKKAAEGNYKLIRETRTKEVVFYTHQTMEKIQTENVLGFIEGSDKKDEFIIITAHYDHEGIKGEEIYNGADDDGSGTVAVLELAQAFALAKKEGRGPRRSILFMTLTGEEKGLLGSEYYVNHPALPLAKTITNLNIDMIGRVDEKHTENPDYVYLIGSDKLSLELHELSENVNKTYTQLELDYTFNADDDPNKFYSRSDHYNFAKNGIPVIFYFNGTHDDYHKPTDTIEKINFEQLEKRTKLVFYTAWEIANRDAGIAVDVMPTETESDLSK